VLYDRMRVGAFVLFCLSDSRGQLIDGGVRWSVCQTSMTNDSLKQAGFTVMIRLPHAFYKMSFEKICSRIPPQYLLFAVMHWTFRFNSKASDTGKSFGITFYCPVFKG